MVTLVLTMALGVLALSPSVEARPKTREADPFDRSVLPIAQPPFEGHVGLRTSESVLDFPAEVRAPEGAPNVLLIMPDDVGFGAASAFGGPIPTPALDRIAEAGLRYNQFHTTALCSPTRAALITGRNSHSVSTGVIMELATGFPGYNSLMSKANGTVAEILKQNGYNTAWYGKNHNVPDWDSSQASWDRSISVGGPDLASSYFYGFVGGDTEPVPRPRSVDGTRNGVEPPVETNEDGSPYHFDDRHRRPMPSRMMRASEGGRAADGRSSSISPPANHARPAPGAGGMDRQIQGTVRPADGMQYREETFARQTAAWRGSASDAKLTQAARLSCRAWDSVPESRSRRRLYARMMEVFAAFTRAHRPSKIGRLVDAIDEMGELDNTLVIYHGMGDNGVERRGRPQTACSTR